MKNHYLTATGFLVLLSISSWAQKPEVFNLQKKAKNKGLDVFNRELTLINESSYKGIRLSKDYGEGVVWLKGIEFSNGILEFDARGEDVEGHSFIGIAFHGKDNNTFDAIYLRPFRFNDSDEAMRSHSIQYIALPNFTWRVLREKFPNKFEHAIDPSPDPNSWVRIRVVIKDATVSTYINGNSEPSLVVEKVNQINSGTIGFYVADTSGGDFANLTITKTN
jgi:hypothetical protein